MKSLKKIAYIIVLILFQMSNGIITLFCLSLVLWNKPKNKKADRDKSKSKLIALRNEKFLKNLNDILYCQPLLVEVVKPKPIPNAISIIELKIQFILKYKLGLFYLYQLIRDEGNSEYADKLLRIVDKKTLLTSVQKQELIHQLDKVNNLECKLQTIIDLLEKEI